MSLLLSDFEARHILHWATGAIEGHQHWGDGASYLPLEENLIGKLKENRNEITITDQEADIIYFWGILSCGEGQILLGEDEFILNRLLKFYRARSGTSGAGGLSEKIRTLERILERKE